MGYSTRPQRNYRTQVVAVPAGAEELDSSTAELGFQFINYIHRQVTVLTRTGLRIIVPYRPNLRPTPKVGKKPTPLDTSQRFIIRVKINANPDVILDTTELSNDLGHVTSVEAQAFKDSVQLTEDKFARGNRKTAWVEYHIPVEDFDSRGGVLYLQNIDLQVSVLDQASTAPHPMSNLGQRNRDAYGFKEDMAPKGVFYGVYIRDRDRQHGQRYININGSVYGVPIIDDEENDTDGVYQITCGRTTSDFVPRRVLTEFYTFEEADAKLGLYQTYQEALALGNPQDKFKREIEERRQTLTLQELQFREERATAEREAELARDNMKRALMEYEHEVKRVDQLNRLVSAEMERRDQNFRREMHILKEISEARGHERRESMEILKLIPTVIATVATYVAAWKKIKSL